MTAHDQVFEPWPKISRLKRTIIVTEKIDGTNAQVHVLEDGTVLAGSRSRYITPEHDNYGFAAWVKAHEEELRALGPGRHYGEWWGPGIQRGYGLREKRFSLFNTHRWRTERPGCCYVVPILYEGTDMAGVDAALESLRELGSVASPGFMRPEGVVVFHSAGRHLYKVTLDKDEAKGAA